MVREINNVNVVLNRLKKFPEVHSILLFGSRVKGEKTPRSDYDICVVAPNAKKKENLANLIASVAPEGVDVVLFETLPLFMKIEVIENHKILYTKNALELYEYFYFYRKLWGDQKHRQKLSKKDALEMIKKLSKNPR